MTGGYRRPYSEVWVGDQLVDVSDAEYWEEQEQRASAIARDDLLKERQADRDAESLKRSRVLTFNNMLRRLSELEKLKNQNSLSDEEILAAVERAVQKREQAELQQRQRVEAERRRKFNCFYDCKIISHDSSVWTPSCPEDIEKIKLFPVGKKFPVDLIRDNFNFTYVNSERVIVKIKRSGLQLLNSDACSFLREHQDFIPEKWKKFSRIIFWGTVFEEWIKLDSAGNTIKVPAVRVLRPPIFEGKDWNDDYHEFNTPLLRRGKNDWPFGDAVAVRKL